MHRKILTLTLSLAILAGCAESMTTEQMTKISEPAQVDRKVAEANRPENVLAKEFKELNEAQKVWDANYTEFIDECNGFVWAKLVPFIDSLSAEELNVFNEFWAPQWPNISSAKRTPYLIDGKLFVKVEVQDTVIHYADLPRLWTPKFDPNDIVMATKAAKKLLTTFRPDRTESYKEIAKEFGQLKSEYDDLELRRLALQERGSQWANKVNLLLVQEQAQRQSQAQIGRQWAEDNYRQQQLDLQRAQLCQQWQMWEQRKQQMQDNQTRLNNALMNVEGQLQQMRYQQENYLREQEWRERGWLP